MKPCSFLRCSFFGWYVLFIPTPPLSNYGIFHAVTELFFVKTRYSVFYTLLLYPIFPRLSRVFFTFSSFPTNFHFQKWHYRQIPQNFHPKFPPPVRETGKAAGFRPYPFQNCSAGYGTAKGETGASGSVVEKKTCNCLKNMLEYKVGTFVQKWECGNIGFRTRRFTK